MSKVIAFQQQFQDNILPALQKELSNGNINSIPRLTKIIINVGIGKFKEDKKQVKQIVENVAGISGQKPIITKARKAISNFKLRIGMPVGITVTLRGEKMYHFYSKLVNIVCPRIRDFRGFTPKSMDGNGNLSIGIREHTVFPEVNPIDSTHIHGVQITIHTSAKNNEDGLALLNAMKFPFKKKQAENS